MEPSAARIQTKYRRESAVKTLIEHFDLLAIILLAATLGAGEMPGVQSRLLRLANLRTPENVRVISIDWNGDWPAGGFTCPR